MEPNKHKEETKVSLTFNTSELMYDIKNYAYIEGNIMADDERKFQVTDIAEDGNKDRVTRMLNLAHAECVEMLYPYTKMDVSSAEIDNILELPDIFKIDMNANSGFSQTTINMLSILIHEYMVNRVVADWMSINKPESHANWEIKLEDTRYKIKSAISYRQGMIKRRLQPF